MGLTASSVELLLGTLVLTSNDQALSGMGSSTNVFLTLTFRVRRLASSAWVTKRATETTTSTLWVNSMTFTAKGATICGFTSTDGYDHTESKSVRDGKFVGMAFDEDNQYDLSED